MSNEKRTLSGPDSLAPSEGTTPDPQSAASETDAARCVDWEEADSRLPERPRIRPTSRLVVRNRTGARGAGVTILGVKR